MKKIYTDFSKVEDLNDGTIKVYGYASTNNKDSDGEVISADAMKAALPDYMKWGAVREMHEPKAAGTAIEARVEDDGRTYFAAHIVDNEAIKKVKTSVYKGFSIGGKITERDALDKSLIKSIKLIEVSLVDRPANPEAVISLWKSEHAEEKASAEELELDELVGIIKSGSVKISDLLKFAKAEKKEVKKGLYTVAQLANLLDMLSYLVASSESEEAMEGDGSPIPAKLRSCLMDLGNVLSEMTEEEVSELGGDLDDDDDAMMLQRIDRLAKKVKKEPGITALRELRKVYEKLDPIPYLNAAIDDLKKVLAAQAQKIAKLEAMPIATTGALKVVDKSHDSIFSKEETLPTNATPEEVAKFEIKKIHKNGGVPIRVR